MPKLVYDAQTMQLYTLPPVAEEHGPVERTSGWNSFEDCPELWTERTVCRLHSGQWVCVWMEGHYPTGHTSTDHQLITALTPAEAAVLLIYLDLPLPPALAEYAHAWDWPGPAALKTMPEPQADSPHILDEVPWTNKTDNPNSAVQLEPPVRLGDKPDDPVFVLDGEGRWKKKLGLREKHYRAVRALVEAWPNGMTGSTLDDKGTLSDGRRALKTLAAKDADWNAVLKFPGDAWGEGYKLTYPGSSGA